MVVPGPAGQGLTESRSIQNSLSVRVIPPRVVDLLLADLVDHVCLHLSLMLQISTVSD